MSRKIQRTEHQLAVRLAELAPCPPEDGALPLCREGEPLEVTLARIKAVAIEVFGPDVVCTLRRPKPKSEDGSES